MLHGMFQDPLTNEQGFIPSPWTQLFCSKEEVPGKHEISINRWSFEVRTIQQRYAEPFVRESIVQAVKGWAADLVSFLGPNSAVENIISELETAYGTVLGYDVPMQHFYGVHMEKNEKVQSYSTRMEGSLHQIWVKFPGMISDAKAEIKLRDGLFLWST